MKIITYIQHSYYTIQTGFVKVYKVFLMLNEKKILMTAGMNVTAEIKLGERRVIDYFLSPFQTKVDESMREL